MLKTYIAMMRPLNSFMSGIGVLFAVLVYTGFKQVDPIIYIVGFMTGFLGSASSMLVNDYVDRFVDSVNKPWKPIPSGKASPKKTLYLSIFTALIGIAINILVGLPALLVSAIYIIVGYMYSFVRRYWWSHFIVAFSTTGPIIYGYIVSGSPPNRFGLAVLFSLTIFFVTSGREVLKAIMDIEGDRRYGYNTIPLRYGVENARRIMLILGVIGSAIGILLGVLGYAGLIYTLLMMLAAIIYLYSLYRAYTNTSDREILETSRRNTLYAMLIGLIAFLFSMF